MNFAAHQQETHIRTGLLPNPVPNKSLRSTRAAKNAGKISYRDVNEDSSESDVDMEEPEECLTRADRLKLREEAKNKKARNRSNKRTRGLAYNDEDQQEASSDEDIDLQEDE